MVILGLSACSATEDETFVSAFDAPLTANDDQNAHQQQTPALNGRMLTSSTNSNPQYYSSQSQSMAEPLVVSSSDPMSKVTPVKKAKEEPLELDWSNVKKWSDTKKISEKSTAPQFIQPYTQKRQKPLQQMPDAVQVFSPQMTAPHFTSDTILSAGDTVDITVYGEEELSGSYLLDNRGVISVPLVGEVKAAGLSKTQLQNIIASALKSNGFLERPYVTAAISRLQPIYILGEVRTPGQYDYEPTLDIFKAVALAGGYTPRAAKNKIFITRIQNGQKIKIEADEHTDLLPGDSILIKQRFF